MFAGAANPNAGAQRFSLLLLDEGECYLVDYVGLHQHVSADGESSVLADGKVRLGSHSIMFEPDDEALPIIRLKYEKIEAIEPMRQESDDDDEEGEDGREGVGAEAGAAASVEDAVDENDPTPEDSEPTHEEEQGTEPKPAPAAADAAAGSDDDAGAAEAEAEAEEEEDGGSKGKKKKGFGKKGFGKGGPQLPDPHCPAREGHHRSLLHSTNLPAGRTRERQGFQGAGLRNVEGARVRDRRDGQHGQGRELFRQEGTRLDRWGGSRPGHARRGHGQRECDEGSRHGIGQSQDGCGPG